MKTSFGIHVALFLTIAGCLTLPGQTNYTVTERGADYHVWQFSTFLSPSKEQSHQPSVLSEEAM